MNGTTLLSRNCLAKELIVEDGKIICMHCGQVDGEEFANEYSNFNENKYTIVKKSIYQRKYHLENVLNDICSKNKLQISVRDLTKIKRVFKKKKKWTRYFRTSMVMANE